MSDKTETIFVRYREYDESEVYMLWAKIINHLRNKRPIPHELGNELFDLLLFDEDNEKIKEELIDKWIKHILNHFNRYKYNFKKEKTEKKIEDGKAYDEDIFFSDEEIYSTEEMLRMVINRVINWEGKSNYKNKNIFIHECYNAMCKYHKQKKIPDNIFTSHKKYALSSFMAKKIGFNVKITKKNPTYNDFADDGRNCVRLYLKKKK